MIKRIIFDLDNTLIPWDRNWNINMKKALEDVGMPITDLEYKKIVDAIGTYEENYSIYEKETMHKHFEKVLGKNIPISYMDKWIKRLEKCYIIDDSVEEVLKYLSEKYELVVLTNWFTNQQKVRLENAKIAKYFKEIIGTDKVLNKPNKEAFIKAMGPYKSDECLMIGDNLKVDIEGAKKALIEPIFLDLKDEEAPYKKIKKLDELKEIL